MLSVVYLVTRVCDRKQQTKNQYWVVSKAAFMDIASYQSDSEIYVKCMSALV